MTILKYNQIDYNVVYVDPMMTDESGDGLTPATALKDLPTTITNKTAYIIRRSNAENWVNMKRQYNTGLTHLILLGMPTSDSIFYKKLDQEVIDAWGEDESFADREYANITMNNTNGYYTSNENGCVFRQDSMQDMISENCYFFRNATSQMSDSSSINFMFFFNEDAYNTSLTFKNCKFGYTQYDFEDNDYLENNNNISVSNYSYAKCQAYVHIRTGNNITFEDCIINSVNNISDSYNTDSCNNVSYYANGKDILFYKAPKKAVFKNIKYNVLHYGDAWWYYGGYISYRNMSYKGIRIYNEGRTISSYDAIQSNVIVENMEVTHISCGNGSNSEGQLGNIYNKQALYVNANNVYFKNLSVKFKCMKDTVMRTFSTRDYVFYIAECQHNLQIDGVKFDVNTDSCYKLNAVSVLAIDNASQAAPGSEQSFIRNIDLTFAQDRENIVDVNCNPLSFYSPATTQYNYDISSNGNYGWTSYNLGSELCAKKYIAKNIKVSSPYNTDYAIRIEGMSVKADEIVGRIYMYKGCLEVNKVKNYLGGYTGFVLDRMNFLDCKEYWADVNSSYSPYTGGYHIDTATTYSIGNNTSRINDPQNTSHIYVGKTNVPLFDTTVLATNYSITPAAQKTVWVCPNYIKDNQFFARSANAFCKSWNVGRIAGEEIHNTSLKFYNNTDALGRGPIPVQLGLYPDNGIEITPSTTGKYNLVCYIAGKNYTSTELLRLKDQFTLEVRVPEAYDETEDLLTFGRFFSGELLPDTSSWTNEVSEGLVPLKFEVPINIERLVTNKDGKVFPIGVTIRYNMYSAEGFSYLDPNIELEEIV